MDGEESKSHSRTKHFTTMSKETARIRLIKGKKYLNLSRACFEEPTH